MPTFVAMTLALFFAWMFATAAAHKLRHVSWYRGVMQRYLGTGLAPRALVYAVAGTEAAVAVALLIPALRAGGFAAAATLLFAYAAIMQLQLLRGRADVQCGCAGPASDTTISPSLVLRNVVCALLAAACLADGAKAAADPAVSVSMLVAVVLCAVFLAVMYLAAEQGLANAQAMRRLRP